MDDDTKKPDDREIVREVTLSKPINAYGEEVKVLRLRKPTGADIIAVGNPCPINPYVDPPEIKHDYKKVALMAARLANVPSSSLERLEAEDLIGLGWAIAPFFLP